MKDSHREPHREGTLIRERDDEAEPKLNHKVTPGLAYQQAFNEVESSAVASRLNVFQSLRL